MQVTPLYLALSLVLLLVLSNRVIYLRRTLQVGIGDGGQKPLVRAIRAHGNFVEYVPLSLLSLLVLEGLGAPAWELHALGGSLIVGRALHAYGLSTHAGTSFGRFWGLALNFVMLLVCLVELVRLSLFG